MGFKVPYEYLPNLGGLQANDIVPVLRDPVNEGSATMVDVRDYVRPYKVFVGLINQTGTDAPVLNEFENTLGVTITTDRSSAGDYTIIASASVFTDAASTWVMFGSSNGFEAFKQLWIDNQTIRFGSSADDIFLNTAIEIRVYNYAP